MCCCGVPLGFGLIMLGVGVLVGGVLPWMLVKCLLAIALIAAGIVLLRSRC